MKTYGKLLKIATIALVAAAVPVLAEPVDADEARAAVENWLKSGRAMGCTGMGDVSDVQAYDGRAGVGKFYVISLRNGAGEAAGYVVTSADRKLNPVLAYSDDGIFGARRPKTRGSGRSFWAARRRAAPAPAFAAVRIQAYPTCVSRRFSAPSGIRTPTSTTTIRGT